MFYKDKDKWLAEDQAGWLILTVASMVMTVPFIFLMKSMADSLNTIAAAKTARRGIKRYVR